MDSEIAAFSHTVRPKQTSDLQRSIMFSRMRLSLAYSSNRFEPPRARDQISIDRSTNLEFRQSSARSNQALINDHPNQDSREFRDLDNLKSSSDESFVDKTHHRKL